MRVATDPAALKGQGEAEELYEVPTIPPPAGGGDLYGAPTALRPMTPAFVADLMRSIEAPSAAPPNSSVRARTMAMLPVLCDPLDHEDVTLRTNGARPPPTAPMSRPMVLVHAPEIMIPRPAAPAPMISASTLLSTTHHHRLAPPPPLPHPAIMHGPRSGPSQPLAVPTSGRGLKVFLAFAAGLVGIALWAAATFALVLR